MKKIMGDAPFQFSFSFIIVLNCDVPFHCVFPYHMLGFLGGVLVAYLDPLLIMLTTIFPIYMVTGFVYRMQLSRICFIDLSKSLTYNTISHF